MDKRFDGQIQFLYEIDKLKTILRKTKLFDGSKYENDAEHSWHLAMMTLVLSEYANEEIDKLKVIKMVLMHDIVEIDGGDTIIYDIIPEEKEKEEIECANRIYGTLPSDMKDEFYHIWREFEERKTPEAKFAAAIDRAQPILQNYMTNGGSWVAHGIKKSQVIKINAQKIKDGSERFWNYVSSILDESEKRGYFVPENNVI